MLLLTINLDWQLEKRIIGFRLIDESHSGDNIVERVSDALDDYGLIAKVFFCHFGQCFF